MPPCGEEILTAGDQFSFSNDSIPSIIELDGECAYGSVEDGGFTSGAWAPWQCIGCSNPEEHDHLNDFPTPKMHPATIIRHQKEMLDLLNELPECAYELSLKDLVDLPMIAGQDDDSQTTRDHGLTKEKVRKGIRISSRCEIKGFLMKIFSPVPPNRNRSTGGSRDGSLSSGSDSNGLTKPVTKDGGKAAAAAAAANKGKQQQQQQQPPAVLERDHTRRPSGCCPLFRNSKKPEQ